MSFKEFCLKHVVLINSILLCIAIVLSIALVSLNVLGIIPSWSLLFLIPAWSACGLFIEFVDIWTTDKVFRIVMDSLELDEVNLSGK